MIRHREREQTGMRGTVGFTVYDHERLAVVRREIVENIIPDVWLNHLRNAHQGSVTDVLIRELAWGSGTTTPAAGDTALQTEISRKQVTSRTASASKTLVTTTYIAPAEAVAQLEEWGLFGGPAAGLVMVGHVLWSHNKLATESVQIDWTHVWSEVV